jgi:ABC-type transport system involved in multi-copper enzyme maturation permease subunit
MEFGRKQGSCCGEFSHYFFARCVVTPGRSGCIWLGYFCCYVIFLNAIFVTLLGVSYFSSAISEEKEEDTLGLMTMAGISPLGILLGKSTTRLFQVFLLLALQYPFTLLAITLGGLKPDQISAAYLALLAYTILLANMGLFCSVVSRRNRDAASLTVLLLIGYIFTPLFALIGVSFLSFQGGADWLSVAPLLKPILAWVSKTSVFTQLYEVTETGYQLSFTPQLLTNFLGGIVFFLLSWLLFPLVSHEPATEASTRALIPVKTSSRRWFGAGRAWSHSLAWKDFHFVAGGWYGIVIRIGLYTGLYVLTILVSYPWWNRGYQKLNWQDVTYGYQIFLPPLFAVDCALCASRLFQEEIRHQTLGALLMLPQSVAKLFYSKLIGCLLGLVPGMIALLIAYCVLSNDSPIFIVNRHNFWFACWYVANLFLLIHLSLLFSLYLRWGAFAMSIAVTFGSMFVSVVCAETWMIRRGSGMNPGEVLGLLTYPIIFACIGCHVALLLRIPALGEK